MWLGLWDEHLWSEGVEEERYYWDLPQMANHGEISKLVAELHWFTKAGLQICMFLVYAYHLTRPFFCSVHSEWRQSSLEAWDSSAWPLDLLQVDTSPGQVLACPWIRIQPKHRPVGDRWCCCCPLQWEHEAMVGASNDQIPTILDQVHQVWSPLHPWMQLEWVERRWRRGAIDSLPCPCGTLALIQQTWSYWLMYISSGFFIQLYVYFCVIITRGNAVKIICLWGWCCVLILECF